jgi:hypothetical protein
MILHQIAAGGSNAVACGQMIGWIATLRNCFGKCA